MGTLGSSAGSAPGTGPAEVYYTSVEDGSLFERRFVLGEPIESLSAVSA